jgi:hypothetical protein
VTVSDDARFRIAMTAGTRERQNRPRALIVGALALLGLAAIVCLLGVVSRARAASGLREEDRRGRDADSRLAEVTALRAAQESAATPAGEPLGALELADRLGKIAQAAGLKDTLQPPREVSETRGRIVIKRYSYSSIRSPDLAPVIDWLSRATQEIPGLELIGLELTPDASGWVVVPTLRRWERAP